MTTVYIGLGANLGRAQQTLKCALRDIAQLPGTTIVATSSFYRTAPVDAIGPDYINAAVKIKTELGAHGLLKALQTIEAAYGRTRPYRNAPRILDLDILLYGSETFDDAELTVPHPRMHERAFVLHPLAELEPDLSLPLGSLPALIARCGDQEIRRISDD